MVAVLLAATAALLHTGASRSAAAPAAAAELGEPLQAPAEAFALVFVSGAVEHPGLYRLSTAARVADAVAAAGGMSADADPGHLPDLAARVHDGRQVNVPFRRVGGGAMAGGVRAGRLDLNAATVDELREVPGMPEGLAEAIVDSRSMWGPFGSVSDLRTLLDVDPATVAALRRYLGVGR